ncbi:hypothetical protein [Chitinilyticum litopenaei]|uniref:hypothetical protein n=1 Tax=Chitinilyticum litopenaei TaxID=1121276 RepID=UPI00130E7AA9|nr:hypothetical protein [Chitinilyticum litopenaei]
MRVINLLERGAGRAALPWLAAGISGVLLAMAFPRWEGVWLEPLAFVALLPAFWALEHSRRSFCLALVFALAYQLTLLLPLMFLLGPWVGLLLLSNLPASWLLLAAYGPCYRRWQRTGVLAVWLPLAVLVEYAFSTWWPSNAPWWVSGAILARLELPAPLVAWTGVWGLSAWVLALNVLLRACWAQPSRRAGTVWLAVALLPLLLAALVRSGGGVAPPVASLRVATINPGLAFGGDDGRLSAALQQSTAAMRARPDLLVWPEAVYPGALLDEPAVRNRVLTRVAQWHTPVLLATMSLLPYTVEYPPPPYAAREGDAAARVSGAAMLTPPLAQLILAEDPQAGWPIRVDAKRQLAPFVEFLPGADLWPAGAAWLSRLWAGEPGDRYLWLSAGSTPPQPFHLQHQGRVHGVGAVICFELLFPENVAEQVRNGAQSLVWLTNDEAARHGHYAYQFAWFARLRALENGRDLVRVNTDGGDFAVDAGGRMTALSPRQAGGHAVYTLGLRDDLTFYSRHPRWLPLLCLLLLAASLAVLRWRSGVAAVARLSGPQGPYPGEEKA